VDKTHKILLCVILWINPTKIGCRGNVHSHSSANHENLAKIGPVDFEIIVLLTEIVKNKDETAAKHKTCSQP